jgi:inorganic triphosphatase YgiF
LLPSTRTKADVRRTPSDDRPREVETALVVRARDPASALAEIGRLETLGGHTLEPLESQTIDDTYLDTDDRALHARRVALRLRSVDGSILLALKKDLRRASDISERLELEAPWSRGSLSRIVAELVSQRALPLITGPPSPSEQSDDPKDVLAELGLVPVQRRKTNRDRRSVIDAAGQAVAELALDAVAYFLDTGRVLICEVELEGRAPDADVALLVSAVVRRFPALTIWPHSKLATGFAVERAVAAGRLVIRSNEVLDSDALDTVALFAEDPHLG